ncbi:uncharacterized protein EAF01_009516 [Botrytis porri]|uniref:Uncharacterized protein n=1 Tax=Botrytis porri TaxID=87229 RepID=A0A4Z1KYF6_9HELO|nr:uncharacterized protein EAF01_009516 [Botrytis porri]KAF7895554.1 hypothetical protein EAF01_009516 [Botrytis porri]TGO89578.1 hypothetical protein BPOR_0102g00010 [Botrytis porri]
MSNTVEASMQEPQPPQVDKVTEKSENLSLGYDSDETHDKSEVPDSPGESSPPPTDSKPMTPGYNVPDATMQEPQPPEVDELTKRLDTLRVSREREEEQGEDAEADEITEAQAIVDRIRAHPRRRKLGLRVQALMSKFEKDEK